VVDAGFGVSGVWEVQLLQEFLGNANCWDMKETSKFGICNCIFNKVKIVLYPLDVSGFGIGFTGCTISFLLLFHREPSTFFTMDAGNDFVYRYFILFENVKLLWIMMPF
jgi:hypothetical protein